MSGDFDEGGRLFFLSYISAELRRRRGRTLLTALGLAVGVGVIPAKLQGLDLGPACGQCGGMMQRTGSCYTCSSCGNNTGCG